VVRASFSTVAAFALWLIAQQSLLHIGPNDPQLHMRISITTQDSPLTISGATLNSPQGHLIAFHVHNSSSKAVKDYWIQPLVRGGNSLWHFTNSHANMTPGAGHIMPGQDGWFPYDGLPVLINKFAVDLNSTCLRMTPAIMRVEFEDGSAWHMTEDQRTELLRKANLIDGSYSCEQSEAAKSLLKDWRTGAGFSPAQAVPNGDIEVQVLPLICLLKHDDALGTVALCEREAQ
jgi:hypothetical protein